MVEPQFTIYSPIKEKKKTITIMNGHLCAPLQCCASAIDDRGSQIIFLSVNLLSLVHAHRERLDPLEPLAQVDPREPEESPVSTDQLAPSALQ